MPNKSKLLSEYQRLAEEVSKSKLDPESEEYKKLRAAKLAAFQAWHAAKDDPDPKPTPEPVKEGKAAPSSTAFGLKRAETTPRAETINPPKQQGRRGGQG